MEGVEILNVYDYVVSQGQVAPVLFGKGLGQKHFSHKQLENKSCDQIQDMLMTEKNINWNDTPTKFKRGSCCIKTENGWEIDNEIPIFTQDRDYVEKNLFLMKTSN